MKYDPIFVCIISRMEKPSIKRETRLKKFFKYLKRITISIMIVFLVWFIFCIPKVPFNDSTSTVLFDKSGKLLGAKIATDGQWRFVASDSISYRFEKCILEFEDRGFYSHPGISAKGIGRAIKQNISNGRIVSGGSTITMQLARLMNRNPKRTILAKLREMAMALRLELRYSKKEILLFYASNAPFGNNVVGLEAASWRYFARPSDRLSWAESATLAVLPNAPGLIYPGKNHDRLMAKRNRLLKRLLDNHTIDKQEYELALKEELPGKPLPLPAIAPHLLERIVKDGLKGKTIRSSVRIAYQDLANEVVKRHMIHLNDNEIYNAAVLISEVKTGKVLVYIGNSINRQNVEHGERVDCVMAPRSSGSILKPILYAKSMEDGLIMPRSLMLDVPTYYNGFSPKNFNSMYDGCIHADKALSKSLNIPFVRLLQDYGYQKFHYELQKLGISSLKKDAGHYGLSIILGGAETKLWDINKMYLSMARTLSGLKNNGLIYDDKDSLNSEIAQIDKAAIYKTFEAMVELNRPDEDGNWKAFSNSRKVAWKTGTSFGFRDAWAVGVTPDYVVSVWVGNADGEGRPGLTGVKAAAPLMFDLMRMLPNGSAWFKEPIGEMNRIAVCKASGNRATDNCSEIIYDNVPSSCLKSDACMYHKTVQFDKSGKYRVDSECENPFDMVSKKWFILPPGIEKYYRLTHPEYLPLPPFKSTCASAGRERTMTLMYPRNKAKIFIPIEIDGKLGKTVFEATHRHSGTKIFWHIDEEFIGETTDIHQISLSPNYGSHRLLIMDENGYSQTVEFEIVNEKR